MAGPDEWTEEQRQAYHAQVQATRAEGQADAIAAGEVDADEVLDRIGRDARIYRLQARAGRHPRPHREGRRR